jgi:hypothetical protein
VAKRAKVGRRRRNKVNSYLRESALGENNQQTGFTTSTIADNDELSADLSHGY